MRLTAILLTLWVALVLGHEAWATLDPTKRILLFVISQPVGGDLELFPFLTWGILPALFAYWRHGPWLDKKYFTFRRWTRNDGYFLGALAIAAAISVLVVRLIPSLTEYYRTLSSYGSFTTAQKARYFFGCLAWVFSWLPLWEFMTRGLVLPFVDKAFPKYGWLCVPVLEFGFHLVKPLPEAFAMLAFSFVATSWVRRRQNLMLPFLGHLGFELAVFGYVAFG